MICEHHDLPLIGAWHVQGADRYPCTAYQWAGCMRTMGHGGEHSWQYTDPIDLDADTVTICGAPTPVEMPLLGNSPAEWRRLRDALNAEWVAVARASGDPDTLAEIIMQILRDA